MCERGPLTIHILCSGCYLGIHPNLKFQKSNVSFRGAKKLLEATKIHKYHFTLTFETPVSSKRQGSDQCQLSRWWPPEREPNSWQSSSLLGNESTAVKEASHYLKKSSAVQREVQCQAAAQRNKPPFIWKRMLFVSCTSLLESLLAIAVNVLLTGHFITLLTPWGRIPEKYSIYFVWGQVPGSAVTYCHLYWLQPTSRLFPRAHTWQEETKLSQIAAAPHWVTQLERNWAGS